MLLLSTPMAGEVFPPFKPDMPPGTWHLLNHRAITRDGGQPDVLRALTPMGDCFE
jgi:hypothetical protein